ncbi:lysine-specific demethylase JMJ17 [Argentina anserina]|uniref:lysine-specific demethylase JMJ17 n=1 Tax=Argentina anserina TaxID=57926 RepID=UPI0021768009|nr:lysine-specific demethylase JMJ17 [Potentilla anserina]
MGKGRPRAVEKGVVGPNLSSASSSSLNIPSAPVFYPSEDEFRDPLEYIYKIRAEAEPYGICRIVPPESWKPPFALDLDSFTFQTKTQAIHQLQVRPASCDSTTFELEYNRFLEDQGGKRLRRKVVFEGEELDLCKLFNAVKRYGGFDKVVKEKKWGEVVKFVRPVRKVSECSKHVLHQLYLEHLIEYEEYYNKLNNEGTRCCKRGLPEEKKSEQIAECSSSKRRRMNNNDGEKAKARKVKKEEEEHDQICEQCRSGLHGEVMLLCDRCDKGWHIYCLSPPLKQIPSGNWYCFDCLNSDEDCFGFVPGKRFSLEAFRRVADRAKKKWFGSGPASRVQIEKKFWEIVEGSIGEVEVMYGSDLDTSIYGSGFPRVNDQRQELVDAKLWDEYCGSPWNLNNLPKLKGSVLRAIHNNITGVMVPWLYMGMLFSSFCWHFEDHCFYSMNYHHWGEPKCWYSVPGSEASAFEKVMRNSLPDLFDAQPDLLFQLVTMLNPSVLQENGVPVYTVLQEPGNFVITFPRSYHGGFNLGLNCAEAVNFAPADWLPHGGFGAGLYQLYHKTAVLSHEELVCVLAKSNCDSRVSPYVKKELVRIYKKEKTWRERLWRKGIIKSSLMSSRKFPEYVGTEEDPMCIICQQYLYLSGVVCRCRPSTFVCLEHSERLCECKSGRLRLHYRHTLAELHDLVLGVDKHYSEETTKTRTKKRQLQCSNEPTALTKKVKGGHASFAQLADQWLLRACRTFQGPYSREDYVTVLKEAEQFVWAGSEMKNVREMANNLKEARKWAEDVRKSVSKIESWSSNRDKDLEKIHVEYINELLSFDSLPCDEPGHLTLKDYAEKARMLIGEINTAVSSCSKVPKLDLLYNRVCEFPVYVKESERLQQKISSAKFWIAGITNCISEKQPAAIKLDFLYKLKLEIPEVEVQLSQIEMLSDLVEKAESCRAHCVEILKGPITLKDVEALLLEWDTFIVEIPELKLLRQYHTDAVSWNARFKAVLIKVHEREDQQIVVDELEHIRKDGQILRIQVDQMPLVEFELKKARCREKALRMRETKVSLDFIQEVVVDAEGLHIEGEQIYVDMSKVLDAAIQWDERGKYILAHGAHISDFEDVIRSSENIHVTLPSLLHVKEALSKAVAWLSKSEPFLLHCSLESASSSLLKVDTLKELISESNNLKVSMKEIKILETVLMNCEEWENDVCSLLQDTRCLLDMTVISEGISEGLISKIEHVLARIGSLENTGLSLTFDFVEHAQLKDACSMLQWCKKAISFCSAAPTLEDVESLMSDASCCTNASGALFDTLFEGVKWLKKATEIISASSNSTRCKFSEAEEVLADSQSRSLSFPLTVTQIESAIEKHKSWLEQVHQFFSLRLGERSWSLMLQLKEFGIAGAFNCPELDSILSEVERVQRWKRHCMDIFRFGEKNSLLGALEKLRQTLDSSMHIYDDANSLKNKGSYACCSAGSLDQEFVTCSSCKKCYHLRCLGSWTVGGKHSEYVCLCCQYLVSATLQNEGSPQGFGVVRPAMQKIIELLSEENFCVCIEEREILKDILKQARVCKAHLEAIVDFALAYVDKDLSVIFEKLATALKAIELQGFYDDEGYCNLTLALSRYSWKVRVDGLLEGSKKPTIQQIQQHLKERVAVNISPADYYKQKLTELKCSGLQWADKAKKVAADAGALPLDKVFELISEGENLPVLVEKELKLLKERSMLYCICRKPYDQRAMIACDKCDEWYHFGCMKLHSTPKVYICPACEPQEKTLSTSAVVDYERCTDAKCVEPKTPSPKHTKSKMSPNQEGVIATQTKVASTDDTNIFRCSGGIDRLWWRNRKPFRRAAKKRAELDCQSLVSHLQQ